MRIVAPFRFLEPEAEHHKILAGEAFDWPAILKVMVASAEESCRCAVHILTDPDFPLDLPALRYESAETRLMLWNLDIVARFAESDAFDQDTVVVDCDQLFYGDLAHCFGPQYDLGLMIRPKPMNIPILNGVQFLAHRGKPRLADFYRQALAIAKTLPEEQLVWGADTHALRILVEPLEAGLHKRAGLTVRLMDHRPILRAVSEAQINTFLQSGRWARPNVPVLDFRYMRKRYMKQAYEATFAKVPA